MQLLDKESVTHGLCARFDRKNKFRVHRNKDARGMHVYVLQNTVMGEKICIPRFLLDRFRAVLTTILHETIEKGQEDPLDLKVYFRDIDHYAIRSCHNEADRISIQEYNPAPGSTGFFTLDKSALKTLVQLLYDPRLCHPNDILGRIIAYHKLFNFTFAEGSESITSDLSLRKDVLSQVLPYVPTLASAQKHLAASAEHAGEPSAKPPTEAKKPSLKGTKTSFRSRLAEKNSERNYQIEYETLFQRGEGQNSEKVPKAAVNTADGSNDTASAKTFFSLPILASDIKSFSKFPFRVELTAGEIKDMRDYFLTDREDDFFVGFELVDVIFKHNNRLQTYRFPLYYFRVKIEESGRHIALTPSHDGTCYLNHLALANTVETFASSARHGNPVDNFFNTLLAQKIECGTQTDRIRLSRILPVAEAVFKTTREILIGQPGEGGLGGILSDLNVVGIECDLESVALYKAAKSSSPLLVALDEDLAAVEKIAMEYPQRFYTSLVGRFLTPELNTNDTVAHAFGGRSLMPGATPPAVRKLLQKLRHHNLVLLEGPPGTGKTHTIMNLFFDCVNNGKRLLIVSDQKAALAAIVEKLDEYLVDKDRSSPHAKQLLGLWKLAIKVIDEVPADGTSLAAWARLLAKMLEVESPAEPPKMEQDDQIDSKIDEIDRAMAENVRKIDSLLQCHAGPESEPQNRVTPKRFQPTTREDINGLLAFLHFVGLCGEGEKLHSGRRSLMQGIIKRFIRNREILLTSEWNESYPLFAIDTDSWQMQRQTLHAIDNLLSQLILVKPRSLEACRQIMRGTEQNAITSLCLNIWQQQFPPPFMRAAAGLRKLLSYARFPALKRIRLIKKMIRDQLALFEVLQGQEKQVFDQLLSMHEAIARGEDPPLCLEISRFAFKIRSADGLSQEENSPRDASGTSVQQYLYRMDALQKRRDVLIKELYLAQLGKTATALFVTDNKGGTSAITAIKSLLDSLAECRSITRGSGVAVLKELREKLFETFPVWLCRKQVVPFIFPTRQQIFDLVIVDEAGQCRVDDALPIMFRAKKLMVVGDDKQTVLEKNSVIDDYLFSEFDLDEHLRFTGAHGIKGGGSNIFGLVKSIRQANVILDEHYRCPPEIIQYSNKYVYDNSLKIMQWAHPGQVRAVEVSYLEENAPVSEKPVSGKFKGIEVDMIDRFLQYVTASIRKIEKENGKHIDMQTDVAICYFLLKNGPYIEAQKGEFLRKIGRGGEVLNGAGAALQGKERDYIFYLWDINRYNLASFRQGDDADKRKGELNVLMSRPKLKAFHYLHKNFRDLDHSSCTITDYLWRTYQDRTAQSKIIEFTERKKRPGRDFLPWTRSSGALLKDVLLARFAGDTDDLSALLTNFTLECSVVVGAAGQKVDLMLIPKEPGSTSGHAIGLIDLSGFDTKSCHALELVDYFFQLQRARPAVEPIFLYIHELADCESATYGILKACIKRGVTQGREALATKKAA